MIPFSTKDVFNAGKSKQRGKKPTPTLSVVWVQQNGGGGRCGGWKGKERKPKVRREDVKFTLKSPLLSSKQILSHT